MLNTVTEDPGTPITFKFAFLSFLKQGACMLLVFTQLWWMFCR